MQTTTMNVRNARLARNARHDTRAILTDSECGGSRGWRVCDIMRRLRWLRPSVRLLAISWIIGAEWSN